MRAATRAGGALVLVLVLAACTSAGRGTGGSTTTATSSGPSSPSSVALLPSTAYVGLLIVPSDIPIDGLEQTARTTSGATASVAGEFDSADGATRITDVITVFPTVTDARLALAGAQGVAPGELESPSPSPAPITSSATGSAYAGTEDADATTVAVFAVGRAFVTLRFQSDPADPIPTDAIDQVIMAQTTRITDGLS